MILAAPALGQTGARQRPDGPGVERVAPLPKADVTLQRKSRENVVTTTGTRFIINSQTLIVGPDGQELSISGLPVPCEATVTYVTRRGERMARHVHVKWVSANATVHMESDVPH